jgi:hypothetical protein
MIWLFNGGLVTIYAINIAGLCYVAIRWTLWFVLRVLFSFAAGIFGAYLVARALAICLNFRGQS